MIPFISKLFNLPVTRKEVLKRAIKYREQDGLCTSIRYSLYDYGIECKSHNPRDFFPKFKRENAIKFGALSFKAYWWERCVWSTGRMDFLNWLIDQYKDDKTNLRKL